MYFRGCAFLLMITLFSLGGLPALPQNPHSWRASFSLLVWLLSYGRSGLGDPTRNIKYPPTYSVRSLRPASQGGDNTNIEYATTETQKCVLFNAVVQLKQVVMLIPSRLSYQPNTRSVQTCAVIAFGFG